MGAVAKNHWSSLAALKYRQEYALELYGAHSRFSIPTSEGSAKTRHAEARNKPS